MYQALLARMSHGPVRTEGPQPTTGSRGDRLGLNASPTSSRLSSRSVQFGDRQGQGFLSSDSIHRARVSELQYLTISLGPPLDFRAKTLKKPGFEINVAHLIRC